jgi:hypothetical protein
MTEIDQNRSGITRRSEQERQELKSRFCISEKDQKAERTRLLNLALNWDCIDVAKEFIFKNSFDHIIVMIFISFSCLYY